jgi:importin subunit alpha-2
MITDPLNIFKAVTLNFLFQAVIDANIFPVLIEILGKAEFKTRKEAAWAITNATSGGTAEQIRYLVDQGCIPPLCDLLTVMDGKIVQVALNGLENILRLGDQDAKAHKGVNPYAVLIEECYGELRKSCTDLWLMF